MTNTTDTGWESRFDKTCPRSCFLTVVDQTRVKDFIRRERELVAKEEYERGRKDAVEFIRANSSFIESKNQKLHKLLSDGNWDEGHDLEDTIMYQVFERTLEAALETPSKIPEHHPFCSGCDTSKYEGMCRLWKIEARQKEA